MPAFSPSRIPALIALSLCFGSTGSAYYYYVHYAGRTAPFQPIFEKFDLNALNNKTVQFFVSDQGPAVFAPGDSYQAVVSELRSAAKIWNDVSTSDLRVAYGGLITAGTSESAPAIEVDFSDDIPPGLLALSGPEAHGPATQGPNGQFVPILQSHILFKRDVSQTPSYSELFFVTAVHEFGHTLGLQHTFTSSAMSTIQTSAATRAAPLSPDDIAAISGLYPAAGYQATVGGISGRVTLSNGTGVNMASVVAISTSNPPISALTNPDGTFEIDGLPPQQYYIYVHSLPPPHQGESTLGGITPPVDAKGAAFPAGPSFTTQFYPGTRDFNQAQWVFVYSANVTGNVNFTVTPRNSPPISSVLIYGYTSTSTPVTSPQLFVGSPTTLVADGTNGLLQNNNSLVSGLNVGMLGTSAIIYNVRPYSSPFIAFDIQVGNTAGPGPKHLVFSTPNDLYVRPAGFSVVQNPAPSITSITPAFDNTGNRIVSITGANLQPDTRIYFDGLPGTVEGVTNDGKWLVTPPAGPPGYATTVVALNSSDAQSSLFLQPNPSTFTYDSTGSVVLTVSPQFLSPASDTVVDIVSQNTNFVDGQVSVGFGSSDVQVKKVQVLSPTHLQVTATAPAGVFVPVASVNVTNGLRILAQSQGTPVQASNGQ